LCSVVGAPRDLLGFYGVIRAQPVLDRCSIEIELLNSQSWKTVLELSPAKADYIESFYNPARHRRLGSVAADILLEGYTPLVCASVRPLVRSLHLIQACRSVRYHENGNSTPKKLETCSQGIEGLRNLSPPILLLLP
jgi:hypothetical protein